MITLKPLSDTSWHRLFTYFFPHKRWIFIAIVSLFLFSIVDAGMVYFVKPLIDDGLTGDNGNTLRIGAALVIGIFVLRGITSFISNYAIAFVSTKITFTIRQQAFDKLQKLPMPFFDENSTGSLISKLSYDAEQIALATSKAAVLLLRESLIVIVLLGLMFYTSWQLSLIFLVIGPVIAFIIKKVTTRFKKISITLQETMGEITKITEQSILSHQEVLTFNNSLYMSKKFARVNNQNRQQAMKFATATALSNPIIQLIASFAIAIVLLLASVEEVYETLTPGTFTMILFAMGSLLSPLKQLSNVNQQLQKGFAAATSLFTLIDQDDEPDHGLLTLSGDEHEIQFSNLTHYYQNAKTPKDTLKPAIKEFSAIISTKRTYALVGSSGSGKTSITNLLLRLYQTSQNTIFINDIAIEKYTLQSLRTQFSLVSQHIVLIDDTLANNIAFGSPIKPTRLEVEQAALAANVMDFANNMKKGLDSRVGENGKYLSGGQRQRVAIARAILRNSPIIILDEATSALDNKSEQLIHQAFSQLAKNKTMLIIAHRLSTIEHVDCILVMDGGQLIEQGSHQMLMQQKGYYHSLYSNKLTA
ncbi:MAG: subfamily B ATP-binding cassette protein MsbA [Alteromonadaceae bacterium]|jgi:subfamily B ATP-binding cassette protein MsbA